jgi:hypothetical protein
MSLESIDELNKFTWIRPLLPITIQDIQAIERKLDVVFPNLFVECVLRYNGAYVQPSDIYIKGRGLAVLNVLTSLVNYEAGVYLVDEMAIMAMRLPPGLIPFALDPSGNHFCFDYRGDTIREPSIVFVDHEGFTSLKGSNIFQVCSTFEQLLRSLHTSISEAEDNHLKRMAMENARKRNRK